MPSSRRARRPLTLLPCRPQSFLAAKTLVKHVAKACADEGVPGSAGTVRALAAAYRDRYPALTRAMLAEALPPAEEGDAGVVDAEVEASLVAALGRITGVVDAAMERYYEKVAALKRARAAAPPEPEEEEEGAPKKAAAPKRPERPPEEEALIARITELYTEERAKHIHLPKGRLEILADEVKKERGMEDYALPARWPFEVRRRLYKKTLREVKDGAELPKNVAKELFENVYNRYREAKHKHGGKLPPRTFAKIMEEVRADGLDIGEVSPNNLKIRCQKRFSEEHPEFDKRKYLGSLSEEDKLRRQVLYNEVVTRLLREKKKSNGRIPHKAMGRVVREAQEALGMEDVEVNQGTVRDRLRRKAYLVHTGANAPKLYDEIDVPLVTTLNAWLKAGVPVTAKRGVAVANLLRQGKQEARGADDAPELKLNHMWWKRFLARNKKELVRSANCELL